MQHTLKESELLKIIRDINNSTAVAPYGASREFLQDLVLSIYDLTSDVLDKYKGVKNEQSFSGSGSR